MKENHPAVKFFAIVTALLCVFVSACKAEIDNPKAYYTVSYETAHGTAPETIKVLSGTVLTAAELPELTEDGFIFDGWYIGSSKITSELGYTVNSNIKLTAKWEAVVVVPPVVKYTIDYQTDYGTVPASKEVTAGTLLTAADLPELQAQDYNFDGWYIGSTHITADSNYAVNQDITLVAKWTQASLPPAPVYYTISYSTDYDQAPQSIQVESGTILTYEELPDLSDDDHTFQGWYFHSTQIMSGYIVLTDMQLVAVWDDVTPPVVTYTVSYYNQFGSAPGSWSFTAGETLTGGDLLTLYEEGYLFAGWYFGDIKMEVGYPVTQDMQLVARWTPYYTVTYISDHGTTPAVKEILSGTALTNADLPNPGAVGYSFAGWYLVDTPIAAGYKVTSDITLRARWNFTITYSSDHGTVPSSKNVLSGYKLTSSDLPVLTEDGYSFIGWYIDSQAASINYELTGNIVLTASWAGNGNASGLNIFITANSEVTEEELNFSLNVQKSGDNYILTATSGYDLYLWSEGTIDLYEYEYFFNSPDVYTLYDNYGSVIPDSLKSNTLMFNEDNLPPNSYPDGTYVIYVQAFKKNGSVYERVGFASKVIKM